MRMCSTATTRSALPTLWLTSPGSRKPRIDPALGLELLPTRTSEPVAGSVAILIPARNEEGTIGEVVAEALRGLRALDVPGTVVVCASDCTDNTASRAVAAGATALTA